MKGSKSN
jgi:hypothetical protein